MNPGKKESLSSCVHCADIHALIVAQLLREKGPLEVRQLERPDKKVVERKAERKILLQNSSETLKM